MARIDVRGVLVPNDYQQFYDYIGDEATSPSKVKSVIDEAEQGEVIDVYVNSPGGVIDVGSEIYTMLMEAKNQNDVKIHITGQACSAASIISMAGWCEMAPTALMMVHCVSTAIAGNHSDMEHAAEMLSTADEALCTAYMNKAGMSKEDALAMMEHETWLNAEAAKKAGLIDEIMFSQDEAPTLTNAVGFTLPTDEQVNRVKNLIASSKADSVNETVNRKEVMKTKLKMLALNARK